MKKLLWLLIGPVLLLGAVWWAQKARWHRIEDEFYAALWTQSLPGNASEVRITPLQDQIAGNSGFITEEDARLILKAMRFGRTTASTVHASNWFRVNLKGVFLDFTFAISPDHKSQSCYGSFTTGSDGSWLNFELTPESCRAARQQIFRPSRKKAAFERKSKP